ncbi:MAG: exodeoxyribonuclease VII large subunit [Deltaproteobacteria bacterium]|nr:exodeoxyribonuclease VII large subunit [Deltaproteobacteria bacterium]
MLEDERLVERQGPRVYTVSGLTAEIRGLLEERFPFVWVEGEVSNVRTPASGHCYMGIKDEASQIRAVMFRPRVRTLRFRPEDGMKVIAQGRVGVYEPRGEYQLVLDYLEPLGVGALALAYEQLKQKLSAAGWFREENKKPLPFLPSRVAVITSPTGAAVRDFLNVIQRRFGNIAITVVPVRVQGDRAAGEISEAIETVNRCLDVDVIVLTRGGGSLEDLWPFNEEITARAIRDSRIPVVSAVGHEIDVTIADLVADLRAPTPSAAAELLVSEKEILVRSIHELRERLLTGIRARCRRRMERLGHLESRLRDPRKAIEHSWMRLDDLAGRLVRNEAFLIRENAARVRSSTGRLMRNGPQHRIQEFRRELRFCRRTLDAGMKRTLSTHCSALSVLGGRLKGLDPRGVLQRGYSITRLLPEGRVLRQASEAQKGDRVEVTLARGILECRIDNTHNS